ncbi:MAG: penicillin-binding transpeptidase domain-containing protein [Candidatus Paceibacterota bacterium]
MRHKKGRVRINDPDVFLGNQDYAEDSRLELPIRADSAQILLGLMFLIFALFSFKIFNLQIVEGQAYQEQSEQNRLQHSVILAERGLIYDIQGEELVWNENSKEQREYPERIYKNMDGLGHILGYARPPAKDSSGFYYRDSFEGVSGSEIEFDELLKGNNGRKIVETNAQGNITSENLIRPTVPGENITLTIDAELTSKLHESLKTIIDQVGYKGGASVIMDIDTGDVLALTSFPEIKSDILFSGKDEETIGGYATDPLNPYLNRAIEGAYAPGSVIKPFLAVAALEEEIIGEWTNILSTGQLTIPNPYFPDQPSIFRDWRAHGLVDMREALAVSSNVYFYVIGGGYKDQEGLGIERINSYSRLFGFGTPTGIRLGNEALGVVPNPEWKKEHFNGEEWRLGDTYHTSIGQYGYLVTPIQMARATGVIANGGTLVTPRIATNVPVEKTKLDIEPAHLDVVRQGMKLAVEDGTARGLNYTNLEFGGKTGTAEVGTTKGFVNSWVIGFFPYNDPQYAFATVLEHGPSKNLIGATAAMRNFFDWARYERPELFE